MKTVKVRIAVAVDAEGRWYSHGSWGIHSEVSTDNVVESCRECAPRIIGLSTCFVEAEVPVPQTETVHGQVSP